MTLPKDEKMNRFLVNFLTIIVFLYTYAGKPPISNKFEANFAVRFFSSFISIPSMVLFLFNFPSIKWILPLSYEDLKENCLFKLETNFKKFFCSYFCCSMLFLSAGRLIKPHESNKIKILSEPKKNLNKFFLSIYRLVGCGGAE